MSPPTILRIKRKRDQDPLQALILENRQAKRSKLNTPTASPGTSPRLAPQIPQSQQIYFKLNRTDEVKIREEEDIIKSILEPGEQPLDEGNQFVIPRSAEDAIIPNELSDMLETFLSVDGMETKASEYVYDVYYVDSEPLTTANHPQSQIGYIRFFEDDDENDLKVNESDKDEDAHLSDDEDSNAEDYYQNDYPSDEWEGSEYGSEKADYDDLDELGYEEDYY